MAAVSHMPEVSDSLSFCTGHDSNQGSLFSHVQGLPLKCEAIIDLRSNSELGQGLSVHANLPSAAMILRQLYIYYSKDVCSHSLLVNHLFSLPCYISALPHLCIPQPEPSLTLLILRGELKPSPQTIWWRRC